MRQQTRPLKEPAEKVVQCILAVFRLITSSNMVGVLSRHAPLPSTLWSRASRRSRSCMLPSNDVRVGSSCFAHHAVQTIQLVAGEFDEVAFHRRVPLQIMVLGETTSTTPAAHSNLIAAGLSAP